MSRFDYRDPGTDPAYCDGLAPEPDPPEDDPLDAPRRIEQLTADGEQIALLFEAELNEARTVEACLRLYSRAARLALLFAHVEDCALRKADGVGR